MDIIKVIKCSAPLTTAVSHVAVSILFVASVLANIDVHRSLDVTGTASSVFDTMAMKT